MEEALAALPWPQIGATGLLAMAVFFILRGALVPRVHVDKMIDAYEKQLDDIRRQRDSWRDAWVVSESGRSLAAEQNAEMLEAQKTTAKVVESLPGAGDHG